MLSMRYHLRRPFISAFSYSHSSPSYSDLSSSAETWGQTQYHTITATFQHPGSRDETNRHEGCLTISGGRVPPATDDVRAEIPTNRTIVLLIPEDTMSSAMSSESSEGAGSRSASAESSPRPHRFSFSPASAPATTSGLTASALGALNGGGGVSFHLWIC